jgi:hypothetical protein
MNPFRTSWWSLMASIKGISYMEYLEYEKTKTRKKLGVLPDTNNFLSLLLEYYSFKSVKRSFEVLVAIAGISLIIFVVCYQFKLDFLSLISGLWFTQLLMFAVGIYLKHKYKNS